MKSPIFWSAVLAILIGLAVILYDQPYFQQQEAPPITAEQEAPPEPEKSVVRYPVPKAQPEPDKATESATEQETALEKPLPTLRESDEALQELLSLSLNEQKFLALFHLKNLIQRFVVTIDSLPEKRVSQHHLPVKAPQGKFLVVANSISPENAKRYTPYLQLVETLGIEQAVSIYVRFYDLFQEAYRELGYPKGHFNDRFVAVIDHLLKTPEVKEPIGVVQPLIVYKYADPVLEDLSAGQKILLRIGSENRTRTIEILKELRQSLTNLETSVQG